MTNHLPRLHRPRLPAAQRQFGDYLRTMRQAKRLGVRVFAEQVGLAPGHLSNVENGRVTPPAEPVLMRMADILEVPVSSLLARAGRLSAPDLKRFWASPMIPSLIQATAGWNEQDAKVLQETILSAMTD